MPDTQLNGMRVAILVSTDFEQAELTEPMKALKNAGADVKIVSPNKGKITGVKHDEKQDQFEVDLQLEEVKPDDFDGVMIPGGALNADFLRVQPKAQEFVKKMDQDGKPMAIICHGPWLLVSAGLTKGRKMTSYHTIQDDLRNAGANWVDQEVVRDGNWVTSRKPDDLPAFNREMVKMFSELKDKSRRAA